MWVELSDGRTLGVPLAWFPRLLKATPEQRANVEISLVDLHWDELDEAVSLVGLWPDGDISTARTKRRDEL